MSPRGDELLIPIVGNNGVFGGQMGQGKSNACRVVMLGCALDPLAELDVFVFANNGDFDAYQPRLARYRKGVEDDTIAAAVARLHELYAEVGAPRGTAGRARRQEGDAPAGRGSTADLRPVVALFSECHELFGHDEHGEMAAELATKTAKRARKTAITLLFDTQSSRKEAIPPKLVELVSVNACFYVKTWRSNDGFLGDGSFAAGIRATELRPGRDRGTSLITGVVRGAVRAAALVLRRGRRRHRVRRRRRRDRPGRRPGRAGTRPSGAARRPRSRRATCSRTWTSVLGDERVKLRDAVGLLRGLAPAVGPYRTLTAKQLGAELSDAGRADGQLQRHAVPGPGRPAPGPGRPVGGRPRGRVVMSPPYPPEHVLRPCPAAELTAPEHLTYITSAGQRPSDAARATGGKTHRRHDHLTDGN